MSAIFGVIEANQKLLNEESFFRFARALAHRGKDGCYIYTLGNIGFGHQMLFTTPQSLNEKLPYVGVGGSLIITTDSRLDNRNELIDILMPTTRIPLKEICDSQLILLAYDKWGQSCAKHLLGDFVFAIWDIDNHALFCARDHIGIRPLFYYFDKGSFIFSSELLPLFSYTKRIPDLNMLEIADYLTFNKEDTSQTTYKNVFRLPPASTLHYKDNQVTIKKYWRLEYRSPLQLSSPDYSDSLRELIDKAINCRLRTDYPCGTMLSGGLDSSALSVISHRKMQNRSQPLYCYSYALPTNHLGPEIDEREYVTFLSDHCGLSTSFITASGKKPFDNLTEYFQLLGRPLNDLFYFIQEDIYKKAESHGVRILLTGIGGDLAASLNDRGYLACLAEQRRWRDLWRQTIKKSVFDNVSLFQTVKKNIIYPHIATPYNFIKGMLRGTPLYHHAINKELFRELSVAKRLRHYKRYSYGFNMPLNAHSAIKTMIDSGHYPTYHEDRSVTAQHFGIEPCHPYFDIRILEFCMQVPVEQFSLNGWDRCLFRRSMQSILHEKIVLRKDKKPFIPDFIRRLHNSKEYFDQTNNLENNVWDIICHKTFSRNLNSFFKNSVPANTPDVMPVLGFGSIMANFLYWYNQKEKSIN